MFDVNLRGLLLSGVISFESLQYKISRKGGTLLCFADQGREKSK